MGYSQRVIFDFLIELEIKCKLKHWLEYDVHCPSKYQFAFQQIGFLTSRSATELTWKVLEEEDLGLFTSVLAFSK